MTFTVGTHNCHDYAGIPTGFADIIGFTEAIPSNVKACLKNEGYRFVVALRQRDLVVAYKKSIFKKTGLARYKRVVKGWAKVTPNRGTLKVPFRVIGQKDSDFHFFVEHRINAAFPPYVRSQGDPKETQFRVAMWKKHTEVTDDWMQVSVDKGISVIAVGDLNTPKGVRGYPADFDEVGGEGGEFFDRMGACGFDLSNALFLSHMRSDHPRLKATAKPAGSEVRNWHVVTDQAAA